MPELNQMEDNLKTLSDDMGAFQSRMIQYQEQSLCQDLGALTAHLREIQSCKEGLCALNWKPAR
jgi:hypothetical protein